MSGAHLSKDFFDLVKAIGESKSKQEEDRIIVNEVRILKKRFQEKNLSKKAIKESLVRLIYVEMLGHDASFAYVHAIQLTASGDLMQKKVGYLCAALTLSPEHDFRFMLVNQLQRDLASANILEVSIALIALSKLITVEMIPALLPSVQKVLTHENSSVRKKAVLALYRFYQLDAGAVEHLMDNFRRVLCDKDPSVMGASLCLLHELAKENPASQKDLVQSYVSILKQIVEHRLAKDFDYHRIPAPWLQIKLLKILALLGQNDQRTSENMYEVINECMKRANTGIYVGYAIIYECVRTVTTIYPNPVLLDAAAGAIAKFIQSDSHNLKYLGVTGLAAVVRDHPRYATEHQMVVLDCLEDPDETLKRKTLDLLFRMTNPVNAEVVVEKLIIFLKDAQDKYLRQDLVTRICQLAERFAPSNIWYVRTIAKVLELGGEMVEAEVAHSLLRLLAEGVGEEEEEGGGGEADQDEEMRREACEIFFDMFEKPIIPDILLQVMFWTLGEYAYLMGSEIVPEVVEVISEAAGRQGMTATTRGYGITAIMKMCAQLGRFPPEAADLVDKFSASLDVDLQQKCYEFREIARNPATMTAVLPVDASCEDLSEPDFSFLDSFVDNARANGALDYSPPTQGENDEYEYDDETLETANGQKAEPTLKYDAYDKPAPPSAHFSLNNEASIGASNDYSAGGSSNSLSSSTSAGASGPAGLNLSGVKSVWGASGYAASSLTGNASSAQVSNPTQSFQNDGIPTSIAKPDAVSSSSSSSSSSDAYTLPVDDKPEPPKPRAEPEKPKELSERERMAAALFGGVSGDSSAVPASLSSQKGDSATARPRRRPRNSNQSATESPAAAAPSPASAGNIDLLGFDDDLSGAADSNTNSSSVNASLDLLSLDTPMDQSTSSSSSSTPPVPVPQQSQMDDLLGSFGGATSTTSSSSSALASGMAPPYNPLKLNTAQFGERWVAFTSEEKFSQSMAQASTIDDIVAKAQSALGLCVVEVIRQTEEAIFAGSDKDGNTVLLHTKKRVQSPLGADIMLRTSAQPCLPAAKIHCQTLL